jgi:hypothetical protein
LNLSSFVSFRMFFRLAAIHTLGLVAWHGCRGRGGATFCRLMMFFLRDGKVMSLSSIQIKRITLPMKSQRGHCRGPRERYKAIIYEI